jgi:translin
MLDKKYFQAVRQELLNYATKRREVIKFAGDAQFLAKKTIFSLQGGNKKEAKISLSEAKKILMELSKKYKATADLFDEGSFKAALEEYVEAELFFSFVENKIITKAKDLKIDSDIYIGGLCDVPGEILRFAIKSATERNLAEVKRCYSAAEEIINEMVDMNLTGYNRQKFDQAKQALNKLQQVVYEVSLKFE